MAESEFSLSDNFLSKYKQKKPPFGFNGLGELVYRRTYSRIKEDGTNEKWWETVQRVVEGVYNMQKRWIESHGLGWNPWKAQHSAQEMYDRIFNFKFTPPGRGLWMVGSKYVEERGITAGMFNCGFCSTEYIDDDLRGPFEFMMGASMLGVGVGFDVRGKDKVFIEGLNTEEEPTEFIIEDSREGWVESTGLMIEHCVEGKGPIEFDYSRIRAEGEPIKGFGGTAPGPKPLIDLHNKLEEVFNKNAGETITERTIVDVMNLIGKCVVSGNIRRSAQIVLGPADSEEYLDLKDYDKNPERESFGWSSNNSVLAERGMNYSDIVDRISNNGEPGLLWLDNVRAYGRMKDDPNHDDHRVVGTNPCSEQSLEHYELCCLCEVYPDNHESLEEYLKTIKYAYLYAKTITLSKTQWPKTNRVMLRNRRIGLSMTGIAQFLANKGMGTLKEWCEKGYEEVQRLDEVYSDWMAIPRSIKTTSVKPSGTVSLLSGSTPGVHFPESRFYIRRMRLDRNSALLEPLVEAGYNVEPAFGNEESTVVVEIPVDVGEGVKTLDDVSIWEQTSIAATMQEYWSDNQVSFTGTFDPETETDQLEPLLDYFQYRMKSISFLPRKDQGAYKQMPYEAIDEETYQQMVSDLQEPDFKDFHEEAEPEKFCDGKTCELDWGTND